jgi:ATP-dependent DNA helicase RecG
MMLGVPYTLKILSACKEAELPEPEIIEKEGGVQVTIFKAILPVELIAVGPMGGPMGGPIGGPIEEQVAFYSASLSKRQLEVLEIIKANTKISRRKLAEQLNINVSAVQGHLDLLKEKGVLSRKGGTRGIWVILENN